MYTKTFLDKWLSTGHSIYGFFLHEHVWLYEYHMHMGLCQGEEGVRLG